MRVYLRALDPDDYKTSVTWRNDDRINSMIGGPKYFVSAEYEKQWVLKRSLQETDSSALAICLKDGGKYIGNVYLFNFDWINRNAGSAILIGDRDSWGKGFGPEALTMLLRFAFLERGLERIYAHILESNTSSLRLHEKCGYQSEGLLRNAVYKNGRFQSQHILSILRSEFDELMNIVKER